MVPTKPPLGFRKTSSNAIFYGPRKLESFELQSLIEIEKVSILQCSVDTYAPMTM